MSINVNSSSLGYIDKASPRYKAAKKMLDEGKAAGGSEAKSKQQLKNENTLEIVRLLNAMNGKKTNIDNDKVLVEDEFNNEELILRNLMSLFDEDGDFISPVSGLAGMDVTGKDPSEWHQIISISDTYRQEMFDNVKREFIAEKGVANGDTTKRSDVFLHYQQSVDKSDRLKGTWTLGQYERMYRTAMYNAVKESDPEWEIGKSFDSNVLKNITREQVESYIVRTGAGTFALKKIDYSV